MSESTTYESLSAKFFGKLVTIPAVSRVPAVSHVPLSVVSIHFDGDSKTWRGRLIGISHGVPIEFHDIDLNAVIVMEDNNKDE